MKKTILFIVLLLFQSIVFAEPNPTNLRNITDVRKAIDLLIKQGDFSYLASLSSKKGIGINRITSNIQEKEYIFSFPNELYSPSNNLSYQDGYWGLYNFSKDQLHNISDHKKKFPKALHYNLNNVEYQAIRTFENYWETTYKSPIYGKYIIREVTYPKPFICGETNKFLEVSFREAAGGDTASFLFIKEDGFYRLRYY
ncbi:MAG: hypothetical protein AB7F28_08675 [Candidatus Margulisiibacteriota bacterium]